MEEGVWVGDDVAAFGGAPHRVRFSKTMPDFLAEEVASRETHGGQNRVKAARFPQTKTLDDFDFTHQRSVSKQQIAHLHQLDFIREAHNVVFLGPPGTGKTTSQ